MGASEFEGTETRREGEGTGEAQGGMQLSRLTCNELCAQAHVTMLKDAGGLEICELKRTGGRRGCWLIATKHQVDDGAVDDIVRAQSGNGHGQLASAKWVKSTGKKGGKYRCEPHELRAFEMGSRCRRNARGSMWTYPAKIRR